MNNKHILLVMTLILTLSTISGMGATVEITDTQTQEKIAQLDAKFDTLSNSIENYKSSVDNLVENSENCQATFEGKLILVAINSIIGYGLVAVVCIVFTHLGLKRITGYYKSLMSIQIEKEQDK